jgi:hypothetical protein
VLKLSSLLLALAIATPAFAAAPRGGIGPVRTINPLAARDAVRTKIAAKFGAQKGLRITLTNAGLAADKFKVLGPKGQDGMRFSATGTVAQGAGQANAKVLNISLKDM